MIITCRLLMKIKMNGMTEVGGLLLPNHGRSFGTRQHRNTDEKYSIKYLTEFIYLFISRI